VGVGHPLTQIAGDSKIFTGASWAVMTCGARSRSDRLFRAVEAFWASDARGGIVVWLVSAFSTWLLKGGSLDTVVTRGALLGHGTVGSFTSFTVETGTALATASGDGHASLRAVVALVAACAIGGGIDSVVARSVGADWALELVGSTKGAVVAWLARTPSGHPGGVRWVRWVHVKGGWGSVVGARSAEETLVAGAVWHHQTIGGAVLARGAWDAVGVRGGTCGGVE
jgi:hypothetical protein